MTLTVETGAGLSSADALVSVDYATTYHAAIGNTAWASATTDAQEKAIRRATAYLDKMPWSGLRTHGRDQALAWPRGGVIDAEGNGINNDEIPAELQQACAEVALQELSDPGSMTPTVTLASDQIAKREKIGEIEVEYSVGSTSVEARRPVLTKVNALIGQFMIAARSNPLVGRSIRV